MNTVTDINTVDDLRKRYGMIPQTNKRGEDKELAHKIIFSLRFNRFLNSWKQARKIMCARDMTSSRQNWKLSTSECFKLFSIFCELDPCAIIGTIDTAGITKKDPTNKKRTLKMPIHETLR